jgi:adenine-specific DNA-methyltransferase
MTPFTPTTSADVIATNIARLKELFPELVTEGPAGCSVNVDVLKQLVGDQTLTDATEKYGLNWHGKRKYRELALTPSRGTLRPAVNDSVDWDTTRNIVIEGNNLEVLKLLQKSYAGQVKLIYIDPPYNTGKDFVYPDNFTDSIEQYKRLTGQTDGDGVAMTSNAESSGRFHTDWLNMMYTRLKLAKELLKSDGFLVVSCDDSEVQRLRGVLDELFGEEGFIVSFIWKSRVSEDTRATSGVSTDHEYLLCYALATGTALRGSEKDTEKFSNPDSDARGPWRSADLTGLAVKEARPNLHYDLIDPATKINYGCPFKGWRFEPSTMERKIAEGRVMFPADRQGRPRHKLFLNEMRSLFKSISSVIDAGSTADGTREVNALLGPGVFNFPKPLELLQCLIEQATVNDDVILDFFAGSGTTGHAVMSQNVADEGKRRYILVQLPEPLDAAKSEQKTAAQFCDTIKRPRTIAELTKERLRRAGKKIKEEHPMFPLDTGFRVYKLDSTNIQPWDTQPTDVAKTLFEAVEHVKPDRTDDDVLVELLLKLGLDLCVPTEDRTIAGKKVTSIGAGALIVCLEREIAADDAEPLANGIAKWRAEQGTAGDTTAVFRDSAFEDDAAKLNLSKILEQRGVKFVRSI